MYLSIWLGITLSTTQTGCTVGKFNLPSFNPAPVVAAPVAPPSMMLPTPAPVPGNGSINVPNVPPPGARVRYSSITTEQPIVAMTFDDGPHPTFTPKLLDMLKERNIKCTFFLVGQNIARYPAIVRRMLAEGHEIGNHTFTHCSLTSRSDAQIRTELQKSQDALINVAGYRPRLLRPPYGATNKRIEQWIYNEFGYSTIMWSVDPQDWRKPGVSVVTSRLVNGAHKGAIMLAHDIHGSTITAMPSTFDQLLSKGYRFVTVSQLMNIEKSTMPLGVVIRHAEPVTDVEATQSVAKPRRS
jgi:peptidoglycan-N-acetylglucosamine deacetylase